MLSNRRIIPHHRSNLGWLSPNDLYANYSGDDFRIIRHGSPRSEHLMRGRHGSLGIRRGLAVHYSEVETLGDIPFEAEVGPTLCIKMFLEGTLEATIGGERIPTARRLDGPDRWQPVASLISHARPDRLVRQMPKGSYVRKVVICMSADWLDESYFSYEADFAPVREFAQCHLARKTWTPSGRAVATAEQILNAPEEPAFVRALYLESRVMGLVEEAFQQVLAPTVRPSSIRLRPQDHDRLMRIERFFEGNPEARVTTGTLAREIGMSVNSLNRLFNNAYGTSVAEQIRNWKLDRARRALEADGASISEAAFLAGYGSPANFATAFKRRFGFSPSSAQAGYDLIR